MVLQAGSTERRRRSDCYGRWTASPNAPASPRADPVSPSSNGRTSALPTTTPSANEHASAACEGSAIPTPTRSGRDVSGRRRPTSSAAVSASRSRAPVTPYVAPQYTNPPEGSPIDFRRSSGPPGAARKTGATEAREQASIQSPASSTGRSGTITAVTPAFTHAPRNASWPACQTGFAYVMTATGTPSPASLIVPSTLDGVAPSSRVPRDAPWITGPSITGSENGIPTSIASAPTSSSPRTSPGPPPATPPG